MKKKIDLNKDFGTVVDKVTLETYKLGYEKARKELIEEFEKMINNCEVAQIIEGNNELEFIDRIELLEELNKLKEKKE